MKFKLYAIADAVGNIYPGSFGKEDGAWFRHLFQDEKQVSVYEYESRKQLALERGDHTILCDIETNETISVKINPSP